MGNDRTLVEQAMQGDTAAFEQLLSAGRDRAWSVCYGICGNRDDAEDALQDAAIAAWRNLGSFRHGARFSTWFYRIAANAALMHVRRRREQAVPEIPEGSDATAAPFTERIEAAEIIQRALAQVRPDFRAALVLREYGDFTYEDIAAWQQIPVQTVKSRLNRARAALARLVREELDEAAHR